MLERDLSRLREPYAEADTEKDAGLGLAAALAVEVPEVRQLEHEIRADLDVDRGGVSWWRDHLDVRRNCLIGPHLAQSVWSVQFNLLEAGIHLLELREWEEREARKMSRAVAVSDRGELRMGTPRSACPADDLPEPMVDLHTAGFLRAVASALDCAGTAIVGVAALKEDLLRSDWGRARRALDRVDDAGDEGPRRIVHLREQLEEREATAGPAGWLKWAVSYRHMLVHRPRRLEGRQLIPRPTILGPRGQPIVRTELVRHLLRDPGLSEVDAWRDPGTPGVLTEAASTTMSGLRDTAVAFLRGTAEDLRDLWCARRAEPALLAQPAEQWGKVGRPPGTGFDGYAPGLPGLRSPRSRGEPGRGQRAAGGSGARRSPRRTLGHRGRLIRLTGVRSGLAAMPRSIE